MDTGNKPLAAAFWLLAAAVALHFIFTPFYDDATNVVDQVWNILNWLMAIGVVVALAVHYFRKRALDSRRDDGTITREYLEVNIAVYGSIILTLLFFTNWFDKLTIDAGRSQDETHLLIWVFVDPLFVLISGITGRYLWCCPFGRQQRSM